MMARAMLAEEGAKVFDPVKSEDLVGVGWVIKNRASSPAFPYPDDFSPGETAIQKVIFNCGQLSGLNNKPGNAAKVADPEANSGNLTGDGPESARRAYRQALAFANGVINGTLPDLTHGATFYADAYFSPTGDGTKIAYADGRTRFKNSAYGHGLSIPELRAKYGSP